MTYTKKPPDLDPIQHESADGSIRFRPARFHSSGQDRPACAGSTFNERAPQGSDVFGVGSMSAKKHGSGEIMAKLAEADALAAKGKSKQEISAALNISVMTYYRWRKMRDDVGAEADDAAARRHIVAAEPCGSNPVRPTDGRIKQLESENAWLRQLVVDFLLEKARLEEEHRGGRLKRAM